MIAPLLPPAGRARGRWRDHRQVLEGIVFTFRTGVLWRDLPERFGPGRPSTAASPAGPPTAPSTVSWPRPRAPPRWTGWSPSAPPSAAPISQPPPKGARRRRTRTLPLRADHKDPPRLRRTGRPLAFLVTAGTLNDCTRPKPSYTGSASLDAGPGVRGCGRRESWPTTRHPPPAVPAQNARGR
ncbi:transposase [Streptomyces sp. JCM17656]|nr:transposase [Streptomyces sp. JCM17656]